MEERIKILSKFIDNLNLNKISLIAKNLKCNVDDIIDSICLSVTAYLAGNGEYEVIPKKPMVDETGLMMQMIIPKSR